MYMYVNTYDKNIINSKKILVDYAIIFFGLLSVVDPLLTLVN